MRRRCQVVNAGGGQTKYYHNSSRNSDNMRLLSSMINLLLKLNFQIKMVLLDFSLTVKAATLIFISGCGSAISSAKEGKSGFIYNLVKS